MDFFRGRVFSWACVGVFAIFLALHAFNAWKNPFHNWDMLGYIAVVNSYESDDIGAIHAWTYETVRASVTAETYRQLTHSLDPSVHKLGSEGYREQMASDPGLFATMLPFYSIRPGYTGLLYLLSKAGVPLTAAGYLCSIAAMLLMGFVFLRWLVHYVPVWLGGLVSILAMNVFSMTPYARVYTPDMLSAAVILMSLYLWFMRSKFHGGALLMLASVFIRTDNIILVMLVFSWQFIEMSRGRKSGGRSPWSPSRPAIAVYGACALAAYLLINHLAGNYGWWTIFYFTFIQAVKDPSSMIPPMDPLIYLRYLVSAVPKALAWDRDLSLFLAVFLLGNAVALRKGRFDGGVALLNIIFLSLAAHFVLFPAAWARFFLAHYAYAMILLAALAYGAEPAVATGIGAPLGERGDDSSLPG